MMVVPTPDQIIVVEFGPGRKVLIGGTGRKVGLADVSAAKKIREMTVEGFKAAFQSLSDVIQVVQSSIGKLPKPAKVELEFGAKLSGDCDLWVVSGDAEAEFKITVTWEDPAGSNT